MPGEHFSKINFQQIHLLNEINEYGRAEKKKRLTDMEIKLMFTNEGRERERMEWSKIGLGIKRHKLLCVK